jgi:hypothetical protein
MTTRSIVLLLLTAACAIACGSQPAPSASTSAPAAKPAPDAAPAAQAAPEATTAAPAPPPAVAAAPAPPPARAESSAPPVARPPVVVTVPPSREPAIVGMRLTATEPDTGFAGNAFPPTMPDTEWHRAAWIERDCMRCHETGVGIAPIVVHDGLPEILLKAKCRTCHTIATGQPTRLVADPDLDPRFDDNAFPPMIPNSGSHLGAWTMKDCLMCHETGVLGAPLVKHEGMPDVLLRAKCRTCHVQVRSQFTDPWDSP